MSHAHHNGHGGASALTTSAQAMLHCLTGYVIGEVAGLATGVALGLGAWPTIILATLLAYGSGFALGVLPVMRAQGKGFLQALKIIWIGEAVSIGVMEMESGRLSDGRDGRALGRFLDVLARPSVRDPRRLPRRLAGQLLADQKRAQGLPLSSAGNVRREGAGKETT